MTQALGQQDAAEKAEGKKEDNHAILAWAALSAESDDTDAFLPAESNEVVEAGKEILVEAQSLVVLRQVE